MPDAATPRPRHTARQTVALVLGVGLALVLCAGDSVLRAGKELERGPVRTMVLAFGHPAGWVADQLPFAPIADELTGWVSADEDLGSTDGGLATASATTDRATEVGPDAFGATRRPLGSLLITGDSMAKPLDSALARRSAEAGVRTVRDPHPGTGISKADLVDWGKLAAAQVTERPADAVVMFLGANEGFPLTTREGEVECCDAPWTAAYATRVRAIIAAYRGGGTRRVYWMTLPAPRDPDRARIARAVNDAIRVGASGFGTPVQVVEAAELFSPGFRYRDAIAVDGRERLIRNPDGIHLNERGAELLADRLLERLRRDFELG